MFDKPPRPTPSPDDFFASKYAHRERFLINGTQVDSIDVTPENLKTKIPVLVVPGWGATMENLKPAIKVLANKERRVISLDQPRQGGTISESRNADIEEWYKKQGKEYPKFPPEFLRQAETLYGLLEQKGISETDVIAHSMSGPVACIAAMLHPEKFKGRTIVLYNPAGLIGKDNLLRLVKGTMTQPGHPDSMSNIPATNIPVTDTETKRLKLAQDNAQAYSKANPLRAIKEVWALSQIRIEDMLRYVHEKGIRIIVVGAVDDTYFPMGTLGEKIDTEGNVKMEFIGDKGMQKNVKSTGVEGGFVDGFISVPGGHEQIKTHPEIYMNAVETLLKTPQEKAEGK